MGSPTKTELYKLRLNLVREKFDENDFIEHGVTAMNPEDGTRSGGKGINAPICLKEERKLTWMRDTRTGLFVQMELMACRDESDWLIRCYHYAVNFYPQE